MFPFIHEMFPMRDPPPGSANQRRLRRKGHKKSRHGCPTCRKRRVKCDENLPECNNCTNLKVVRCGYLDYTDEQLESIRQAHIIASDMALMNQDLQSGNSDVNSEFSPDSERSTFESMNHQLKLVPHKLNEPTYDNPKYPVYFNETINGMTIRFMVIHMNFALLYQSMFDIKTFTAMLLLGCGCLKIKYPILESIYLDNRGTCMNYLLKNLPNVDDSNAVSLWIMALTLDVSSVFSTLNDDDLTINETNNDLTNANTTTSATTTNSTNNNNNPNNKKDSTNKSHESTTSKIASTSSSYKKYFKLAIGPASILEIVYKDLSKFPKSFPILKFYADSMLNTTKTVWVPPYNFKVLFEFKEIIEKFGLKFINNDNCNNLKLKQQLKNLKEFIEFCLDLFLSNDSSKNLVVRYPIDKLYKLYQIWFSIFPSEAIVLDCINYSGVEKTFYVLWFTLLQLLDCIISSSRYIFTFFLDGFFFTQPFEKTGILKTIEKEGNNLELVWFLNYSCRIISFLDRRTVFIMANTILNEPIPHFLHLKDRMKARPLDIKEKFILSFKKTVIERVHYPSESATIGIKTPEALLNYYMSNKEPISYINNGMSSDEDQDEAEILQGLRTTTIKDDYHDNNEIDLIYNVNHQTSLLYNDFDPRYTDPVFKAGFPYQEADFEFLQRYIEDRRLIIQMTEE